MKIGDTKICKNERKEKKTVNKKIKNQLFVVELFLRRCCFELSFFVFVVVLFFSYYFVCVCFQHSFLAAETAEKSNLNTKFRMYQSVCGCVQMCNGVSLCICIWHPNRQDFSSFCVQNRISFDSQIQPGRCRFSYIFLNFLTFTISPKFKVVKRLE